MRNRFVDGLRRGRLATFEPVEGHEAGDSRAAAVPGAAGDLDVVPLVGGLRAVEVGPHSHEDADIHVWKDARRLYVQAIPKR